MLHEILDSLGDETAVGYWWHSQRVPFAADVSGNALVIDQRQGGELGNICQFDHEGTTTLGNVACGIRGNDRRRGGAARRFQVLPTHRCRRPIGVGYRFRLRYPTPKLTRA